MNATQALIDYGYGQDTDGVFRSRRKRGGQRWKPVDGGWLRYDLIEGQEVPVPYTIHPDYDSRPGPNGTTLPGVAGLSPKEHPHAFVWVYPEDHVASIYEEAVKALEPVIGAESTAVTETYTAEDVERMAAVQEPVEELPKRRGWFGR